jgi:TetR/AcrR family transcriptional regulator, fatty acid metabolism regulator protein
MPATQDPIREQLVAARRNQILDAAAKVFAEKGFHRATTKAIAQVAGVSEGTIYNYFANKGDLVIGIITRLARFDQLDSEFARAFQSDARGLLTAIFRDRTGRIDQNIEMVRAVLPEILISPELRERFYQQFVLPIAEFIEKNVQARVEMGYLQAANVPLTVRAVQGMFVGLLILRILGDKPLQAGWNDMPEVVMALIFDGLRPRDGE